MEKTGVCLECPLYSNECIGQPEVPSPDIVVVGGFPLDADVKWGPFRGRNSAMLHSVIKAINNTLKPNSRPKIAFTYALKCVPDFDQEKKKFNNTAKIVNTCSLYLMQYLDRIKPKVIVALGNDALRALGFKASIRDMRGGIYSVKVDGTDTPVVATYHIVEVAKKPGLTPTLRKDLEKAYALTQSGFAAHEMDISVLKEPREIVNTLRRIQQIVRETGKGVPVAVDTETSSLTPYVQTDRVIAVSLSYAAYQGLAFPFEHRENPYAPEDLDAIKQALIDLLTEPNVRVFMANGKFDMQWLNMHYHLGIKDCSYDVMLAEHVLDEDKKGEYSLKDITKDRFPALGKYEEELKAHFAGKQQEKADALRARETEYGEEIDRQLMDWWVTMPVEERKGYLSKWVQAGFMQLSEASDMHDVRYRKFKGETVIPKKYQTSVLRILKKVQPLPITPPEKTFSEKDYVCTYEDIDLDMLLRYAAIDALTTRIIGAAQLPEFNRDVQRIHDIERRTGRRLNAGDIGRTFKHLTMPLSVCLAHMEYNGVRLDRDKARQYKQILDEKIAETLDAMYTQVGHTFCPSASSPDLAKILYEEMHLPIKKYTDTGTPSTDADTIKDLCDANDIPFLGSLLAYRKMDKCLHTYIEAWLEKSTLDGKIHCSFNQIGTATYRLSSNNPNLQNVPFYLKEADLNLKALFIPDDGYDLYDLDISNAEMRVLTAYSEDEAMIDAFNTGKDLHCLTGTGISSFTYDDLKANKDNKTSEQYMVRQLAKKVNFGTVYCISADGLQKQLWSELRINETLEKCEEYLQGFFETYPGVRRYIDSTRLFADQYCFAYTYTGRRRRFTSSMFNRAHASRMSRQAVNARIQTTSSDLVMHNLIDLQNWLLPLGRRVLLTVHDSIPFQLPHGMTGVKSELDRIIMHNTAERSPWLPVAWKYDVGRGPNYGDTHGEVD